MSPKTLVPLAYEVALQCGYSPWRKAPYQKILVPLDGSAESEKAIKLAQELIPPGGEGILLRVIPPVKPDKPGRRSALAGKQAGVRRAGAMGYLKCVVGHLVHSPGRWRCEVILSDSVSDAIAEFALRERVDLIAMFTHDRKGMARLMKGSIAEKVQQKTNMELRVLRPHEFAAE